MQSPNGKLVQKCAEFILTYSFLNVTMLNKENCPKKLSLIRYALNYNKKLRKWIITNNLTLSIFWWKCQIVCRRQCQKTNENKYLFKHPATRLEVKCKLIESTCKYIHLYRLSRIHRWCKIYWVYIYHVLMSNCLDGWVVVVVWRMFWSTISESNITTYYELIILNYTSLYVFE